jgi:mannose-6-phosphate isomerase-like protein (cupin superfamily)
MPKTSKTTASTVKDFGVAEDRSEDLDGYTVNFVTIKETHDLAPMLAALPGGNCSCPHWGVVLEGRVIVRYPDREEVFEAGDAFYMAPGHAPEAEAGTELVQFSPADQLALVEAAIMKAMQASQSG